MIIIILITVTYNIITMVTNIITEVHYTGKTKQKTHPHQGVLYSKNQNKKRQQKTPPHQGAWHNEPRRSVVGSRRRGRPDRTE